MVEALVGLDIVDGEAGTAGMAEVLVVDIKDGEVGMAGTVEALVEVDIMDGAGGMVDAEVI